MTSARQGKADLFATVKEVAGGILVAILFVFGFYLYLVATPNQFSAECEALRVAFSETEC